MPYIVGFCWKFSRAAGFPASVESIFDEDWDLFYEGDSFSTCFKAIKENRFTTVALELNIPTCILVSAMEIHKIARAHTEH